ncbi:SNF7-like protein [Leptomonas seymouri]|uniref:SNF7-like protein n=1 Tax=Leptomonas seymouri TaxID=5684 RepID=A0A0N1IL91_LEPSE|nr:SNF7-like protein [Leptomonas seymouri]|eukprot:KPI87355.1 SNF7-like protein [Leptomonas seymouri]
MPVFGGLFHKPTPEEEVKQWTRSLRSEQRKIEMQITKIRREEAKTKVAMKQAAKQGDQVAVRMLAKETIRSRKAVNRMYASKAQMNSVSMQLQNQVSQMKMTGSLKKSSEIMKEMSNLVKVKEVQQTMMSMSREMAKAGLIEETMNETIDNALDDDISDTELEDEVNKVVMETVQGQMSGARVGTSKLPQKQQQVEEEVPDEEEDELMQKFNALRSS